MYDSNSKGITYTAGFFMLIAFSIAGMVLSNLLAVQVWMGMTGKGFSEYAKSMGDPAYSNVYRLIQVINMLGFGIPPVLTAYLLNAKPFQLLGFSSRVSAKQVLLVLCITAAAIAIGGALTYVNQHIPISQELRTRFEKMEAEYEQQANAILNLQNGRDYVIAMVVMGLLPAVCEETLFRGGLQNFLTRGTKQPWLSIIIVSIIFSLAHFSFYGFLFRLLLGVVLGLIYFYSGKLWLSIFSHFLNNALVITAYYYDAMKEPKGSWWTFIFIPVIIALFTLYKRESDQPALKD